MQYACFVYGFGMFSMRAACVLIHKVKAKLACTLTRVHDASLFLLEPVYLISNGPMKVVFSQQLAVFKSDGVISLFNTHHVFEFTDL